MKNYSRLKSGTDIRGTASDIFGKAVDLTDEAVYDLCRAFAVFLGERRGGGRLRVSVGHDPRISAARIKEQVVSALSAAGAEVLDCGLSSTPAMFMSVINHSLDGAVQITASHHPADRNGLKFFTPDGGLGGGEISKIIAIAERGGFENIPGGKIKTLKFMDEYSAGLRELIRAALPGERPLSGCRIVVDAGNGAGGFYARDVLAPLGADVGGSVFLAPDGMFPNHIPNPENAEAMQSICSAVKAAGADLGVIFDTDVDRAGCVDSDGGEINRGRLIALAAAMVLKDAPGATIVTDSVTSPALTEFIESLGGAHRRFKRGYRNVIDEAKRLSAAGQNAPLAIESSGHAALRENYFLDDGAYLVTRIIILMAQLRREGRTLSDLISGLRLPFESRELRFSITAPDFRAAGEALLCRFQDFCAAVPGWSISPDSCEGVRVVSSDGWFLLRLSVHDPIMPFNIEGDSPGAVDGMLGALTPFFRSAEGLDVSPIFG